MPPIKFFLAPLVLTLFAGSLSAQVSITIAENTTYAATFIVSGTGCGAGAYNNPYTNLTWTTGASCTVSFSSPFYPQTGEQVSFSMWGDGSTANPRTFVASGQSAVYMAYFTTQVYLTTVNPAQGGTVSGGGWYDYGSTVTVTATPASGYRLFSFAPPWAFAQAGPGKVVMNGPQTITADFIPDLGVPPGGYAVTQIVASGQAVAINNFGQVAENIALSPTRALLWTPNTANGTSGNLTDLGSLPVAENGTPVIEARAINDFGQVVGTITVTPGNATQAFLWQPVAANATTGSMMAVFGSGNTAATGVNSFGQILGAINGPSYIGAISTPAAANGTTGTTFSDSRLGDQSINDFGQAIPSSPTLFTPSAPNTTSGSFTQPNGLPANATLVAINKSGVIVGQSGQGQVFLWTPGSPNGTTGTVSSIPLPSGAVSMAASAMNASGQVVGLLNFGTDQYGAALTTPFLYTGGITYDLGDVSGEISAGHPAGINDKGQIALTGLGGAVYLVTPQTLAPPPEPSAASPQSGNGASQTMVFTFTDPRGWQDLGVVNVLINNFIDGRSACYLAYAVPSSTLYLVNDAGKAEGPYAGKVTLGSSGTIQNSQCTVGLTSANGSGNTLTLTLAVTFTTAFGGNKILYLAAGDISQNSSGWAPLGVWQVPGAAQTTTTAVTGITPAYGAGFGPTAYTFNFSDTKGYQDLGVENILVNSALDGRHACYLAYARPFNLLYLVNDNGDGLLPGQSMAAGGTLSNSQCAVSWGNSAVAPSGNNLSLSLSIRFNSGFGPNLIFYLAARDAAEGNNTGWQASGTWMAQ
ncbi:exported hypothetical protein [Candidatus Sulfopaludibacter sp. SbA4]|nr:exported hypothetical protein [Candidatus Sulfopaludibacter sp. SbA4]